MDARFLHGRGATSERIARIRFRKSRYHSRDKQVVVNDFVGERHGFPRDRIPSQMVQSTVLSPFLPCAAVLYEGRLGDGGVRIVRVKLHTVYHPRNMGRAIDMWAGIWYRRRRLSDNRLESSLKMIQRARLCADKVDKNPWFQDLLLGGEPS